MPSGPDDREAFLRDFARGRAEQASERPYGFVVRSMQRFPQSHDHNFAAVTQPSGPAELLADVEREFADVAYRRIEVAPDALTPDLAAALAAAGYEREDQVVMTWRRPPDTDRPPGTGVVELAVEQRVDIADRVWAEDFGQDDASVRRELAERAHSAMTAAQCTFLGVLDDGVTQASCDLFVRGAIAQIEEVSTLTPFRGRGHASRLVRAAAERAVADDPGRTVFLVADADDWPRALYSRLGFDVTGTRTVWSRT